MGIFDLEREVARVGSILERYFVPLDGKCRSVVHVLDGRIVGHARVEIGHQRSDVLGGGQPRVDVIARVQESACCYGDVAHPVAVERKIKR